MDDFGQTAIEYMLFVAGAIMIALILVVMARSNIFTPGSAKINDSLNSYRQLVNATR
ncbi:hypothetical protein HY993_03160 [Candidatus Micrarchaeota archaeon]|nr:hypothetical protein [Candidatus Micrarchaeota archaeon]